MVFLLLAPIKINRVIERAGLSAKVWRKMATAETEIRPTNSPRSFL